MRECRSCGATAEYGSKFCAKCGAPLEGPWKCSSCGSENPSDAAFCATCGSRLGAGPLGDLSRIWSTPGGSRAPPTDTSCPRCGAPVLTTDWLCPTCEKDLYVMDDIPARSDSPVPFVIGALLILAGVLNIVNGLIVGSVSAIPAFEFCGILEIFAGIVTIPGGFAAMSKKHFVPVFVVSIITLFSLGPCFICSILGFVAVLGLLVVHKDFDG